MQGRLSFFDIVKWVFATLFVVMAIVGNYLYGAEPLLYRVLAVLGLFILAASVALFTSQGALFLRFLRDANIERRKVVWPNRQETSQTTMVVVVVVILMALLLWGADSLLSWLISLLLG